MKIAVIGAGIIGITTAYELACDGHEVTVLERRSAVAEEASFANTGLITPNHIAAWSGPFTHQKALHHLMRRHPPVRFGWPLTARELAWAWRWYRATRTGTASSKQTFLRHLAFYSQSRLQHITSELKMDYEHSSGCMVLLRSEKDHLRAQPGLQALRDAGIAFKELDANATRMIESGLNPDRQFFGAVHLPEDGVANCRQFALLLKNELQQMGVQLVFNAHVKKITSLSGVTLDIQGESQSRDYDVAVICGGADSAHLLSQLKLKIPLAPVHGYSVSATIREPLHGPRSAVIDEHHQVSISRLGNRIRVAGISELGGDPLRKRASALQTLYKVLHDWFPGAANLSNGVQEWKGARAMLPDGAPIVGPSEIAPIWLNLGHGAYGWTLSSGAARILADQIGGKTPALDVSELSPRQMGS